ncbi:hypothetical protein [Ehrlichia canis]|uniref:hypothetical protein n=1 Tax=Ehrlichia canis TaxID=944 RepID=UPI0018F7E44A|nr:hypothetical protein [Ehrlichia canis]UKC53668.1 hypothetical protein s20019040002_000711 [Ehrlichia canis]UKC54606.1 hypothetical protein s20026770001_000712 [Ehrlichia canis]UKC55542.1 hypothetical protein s21009500007_000712 [Ehrlichia canis]
MDIFSNELNATVHVNGTTYEGKVTIDNNGNFDTNLSLADGVGTLGHLYGNISQNNETKDSYTLEYIFEQRIVYPTLPILHSFNGQIVSFTEGALPHQIAFDNSNDNIKIILSDSEIVQPVTNAKESQAEVSKPVTDVKENQDGAPRPAAADTPQEKQESVPTPADGVK